MNADLRLELWVKVAGQVSLLQSLRHLGRPEDLTASNDHLAGPGQHPLCTKLLGWRSANREMLEQQRFFSVGKQGKKKARDLGVNLERAVNVVSQRGLHGFLHVPEPLLHVACGIHWHEELHLLALAGVHVSD